MHAQGEMIQAKFGSLGFLHHERGGLCMLEQGEIIQAKFGSLGVLIFIVTRGLFVMPAQGEMIQAKFGSLGVAARQMEVFSTAVLLATLSPPKPPRKPEWRQLMERLSAASCEAYREASIVPNRCFPEWIVLLMDFGTDGFGIRTFAVPAMPDHHVTWSSYQACVQAFPHACTAVLTTVHRHPRCCQTKKMRQHCLRAGGVSQPRLRALLQGGHA
jgi:hypothetical protein